MVDNARITPLHESIPRATAKSISDAIRKLGKSLPCHVTAVSGSIVTVAFDVSSLYPLQPVTMPMFGPEYIRYPIQVGDKGMAIPADAALHYTAGMSAKPPDLSPRANLATLFFMPLSSKLWTSVDPNAVTLYGPNGVVFRDTASNCIVTLTPTTVTILGKNQVQLVVNTTSVTLTNGDLVFTDGVRTTSLIEMLNAWLMFVSVYNSHTHGGGPLPTPLYTGPDFMTI